MLQEIADLGFTHVELGHGIRLSLMEGIQKFVAKGKITVSSLHNFCPLPVEIMAASPNCYEFTSHKRAERDRAVKLTCQTIDFAEKFGAKFVVLHLGTIPMGPVTDQMLKLASEGKIWSKEFVDFKLRAVKEREEKSPHYLQRVKECLMPVLEYASKKNIRLGIESRQAYEEVPSEREIPALLHELGSPYAGYWHDFGHVQIKHNLSLVDHYEWLSKIAPRLIGCHLHDLLWPGRDHQPPLTGEIEFEKLLPLIPPDMLFVWEMSPKRTAEEIANSREHWQAKFSQ